MEQTNLIALAGIVLLAVLVTPWVLRELKSLTTVVEEVSIDSINSTIDAASQSATESVGDQVRDILKEIDAGNVSTDSLNVLSTVIEKVKLATEERDPDIMTHWFFGSRFGLGKETIITGLSQEHHLLEVTPSEIFVDNEKFPIHCGTARKVYDQLVKGEHA